ncbi:hypothetical protein C8J57DRAFT_1307266, partial [Mycena rebaudengoi]
CSLSTLNHAAGYSSFALALLPTLSATATASPTPSPFRCHHLGEDLTPRRSPRTPQRLDLGALYDPQVPPSPHCLRIAPRQGPRCSSCALDRLYLLVSTMHLFYCLAVLPP